MKNILVFGWFFKQNIGDNFFIEAFQHLFPDYNFKFVDIILSQDVDWCDAVFIGGGSFLDGKPPIGNNLAKLLKKKLFYISVGLETDIHPIHQQLMSQAQLLAIRTPNFQDKAKELNENTIVIPDIAFSLKNKVILSKRVSKSILFIPNMVVIPQHNEPLWKYNSYLYFKNEISQFFDDKIDDGYSVSFWSMCSNTIYNDYNAGIEIANMMKHRSKVSHLPFKELNFQESAKIVSSAETLISQRFHGLVLSEMTETPYVSLFHHDKLNNLYPSRGNFLSYYGLTKKALRESLADIQNTFHKDGIQLDVFEELQKVVQQKLED